MAYELHIKNLEISESEWVVFIHEKDELDLIKEVSSTNPKTGEVISFPLPNSAKLPNGQLIYPSLKGGKLILSCKYVDESSVKIMKLIAKALGGTVFGDEGEGY